MRQSGSVKKNLSQDSDHHLIEKLQALKADKLAEKTKHYLSRKKAETTCTSPALPSGTPERYGEP